MAKKQEANKIVLAYSGGLDTSIILKWLKNEYGAEIVAFSADLGQGDELAPVRERAEAYAAKLEKFRKLYKAVEPLF